MSKPLVFRPTLRRATFGLVLALAFMCGVLWVWWKIVPDWPWPVAIVAVLPLVLPLIGLIDSRRVRLEVGSGTARYVYGLFQQTTRNIVLRNVSDVRVERSLSQRMWGIGTLVIELPGENSRIVLQDIDRPQVAADELIRAARAEGATPRNV